MPSMFPSMAPSADDANRKSKGWKPGEPTPRVVLIAAVLFVVIAVIMIFTGYWQLTADWSRQPANPEEAERMDFVRRNVQILGGINVVLGLIITWLAFSLRQGYRGKRRILLWVSCLAIAFMLLGWVFQFTGPGQSVLALGLAIACLMAFRPSADPFFDAGHRLDGAAKDAGDGTLPGDTIRG